MSRIPPGFPRSPTGRSSQDPVESSCIGTRDSVRATLAGPGTLGELGPAGARRETLSAWPASASGTSCSNGDGNRTKAKQVCALLVTQSHLENSIFILANEQYVLSSNGDV